MQFLTRAILTWLLILALPVQGFAATAMLFCAPSHHRTISAARLAQADLQTVKSADHAGHDSANVSQTPHHGGGHHASAPVADGSHAGAGDRNADVNGSLNADPGAVTTETQADGQCSACASCCTGSALLGAPFVNNVGVTGSDLVPFPLEFFVSYVPQRSDPPPRFLLA